MSGDIETIYGGEFDATQEDTSSPYDVLPAGWYSAKIEKVEVRDSNKTRGANYLWLELTVVGEQYAGRKLFPRITLRNPNTTAVSIGRRELAELTLAAGISVLKDSKQLLGQVIDVRVKIRKDDQYGEDNDVTGYAVVGQGASKPEKGKGKKAAAPKAKPATAWGQQPPQPAQEQAEKPAQPASATGPKKRPWER